MRGDDMQKSLAILALLALAACAETTDAVNSDASEAQLRVSTAKLFSTSARNVRVSSLKQTLVGTEYRAQVGRGLYNCHYFRGAVSCDPARNGPRNSRSVWDY